MIIAGIDEAGYGPLLGPLAVGCCAFEVDGDVDAGKLPCLWKLLRKFASKHRSKTGKTIHVNDSKLVYSPSAGVKELERAVLVLAGCAWNDWAGTLDDLLDRLANDLPTNMLQYPWYGRRNSEAEAIDRETHSDFPLCSDGLSIRLFTNAARQSMFAARVRCVHLCVNVLLEQQFNQQCEQTRNKSSVLFRPRQGTLIFS